MSYTRQYYVTIEKTCLSPFIIEKAAALKRHIYSKIEIDEKYFGLCEKQPTKCFVVFQCCSLADTAYFLNITCMFDMKAYNENTEPYIGSCVQNEKT